MSLKDLAQRDTIEEGLQFDDEPIEESKAGREQYRVVKKDLLFKVNFQQNNNKYRHGENSVVSERTLSDFRKLGAAL